MSLTFDQLITRLHSQHTRRRIAVACPNDAHTLRVIQRSLQEGIADFALVVEEAHQAGAQELHQQYPDNVTLYTAEDTVDAARMAVALVHHGEANVLMKGTLNTDVLLRAVLNKEEGPCNKNKIDIRKIHKSFYLLRNKIARFFVNIS